MNGRRVVNKKETGGAVAVINSLGVRRARGSNDATSFPRYRIRAPRYRLSGTFTLSANPQKPLYAASSTSTTSKMGWLPWSSGDTNKASDGGRIAPDRTSRARCWEGRDLFFACLDRNDILDGIKNDKEARQKCAKEVAEFEAACSQSWVRTVLDFLYGPGLASRRYFSMHRSRAFHIN